jgi:hypothetical protein
MAALMVVAVMALVMGMLVAMDRRLVAVLLAVVDMSLGPVGVFVLMLVFAVATHLLFTSLFYYLSVIITKYHQKATPAGLTFASPCHKLTDNQGMKPG